MDGGRWLCNSAAPNYLARVTSSSDTTTAGDRAQSRWQTLALALAAMALALLAYLPAALRAQFLNFDDNLFFGPDNPVFVAAAAAAREGGLLAGLSFVMSPAHPIADAWLPLAHGSLWLDFHWAGQDAVWAHLHSALLHGLAGIALLQWLRHWRVGPGVAAGTVAFFLLHPALCESVAWVSGRKDVLSGLFCFLALWAAALHAARGRAVHAALAAALVALAMLAKATAVVAPLLALVHGLAFAVGRRRWLAPLLMALACAPLVLVHQSYAAAAGTLAEGSLLQRLPQVPGALLHYAQTALWPLGLNVLHPEVATLERLRAQLPLGLVTLGLLAAATALAWRLGRRSAAARALAAASVSFFAAILPFNTAYPASVIGVADRYLYLAAPFCGLVVMRGLALAVRPRPWVAVALGIAAVLLVGTWRRAADFADSERLWRASLEQDADNAVALLNLTQARVAQKGGAVAAVAAEIEPYCERAALVARYPEHERRAALWLVRLAAMAGRREAAALWAERAVAAAEGIVASGRATAATAQALLVETLLVAQTPLREASRIATAEAMIARAQELSPQDPRVAAARTLLLVQAQLARGGAPQPDDPVWRELLTRVEEAQALGDSPELDFAAATLARLSGQRLRAIASYRRALAAQPDLVDAWVGAAEVCLDSGLAQEAEDYARSAIARISQQGRLVDPRLRLCLARALQGQGRLDEAIGSLQDYCDQAQGRDEDARRLLSGLLMHKARQRLAEPDVTREELQRLVDRALAYNKDEPAVDLVRAKLARDGRQFAAAVEALERLQLALPELDDARVMLAESLRDLGYERLFAKDDRGAAAAWLRLREVAPDHVSIEAVQLQMNAMWRRLERQGIEARQRGDEAAAAACFRLCLQLDPAQHWAAWLLVSRHFEDPAADAQELDAWSQQALAGQQQHGLDCSRQLYVRARVLDRLGRRPQAQALLAQQLDAALRTAEPEVARALESLRAEWEGR